MADQEAYRRYTANAEALLKEASAGTQNAVTAAATIDSAGVWAMLALAAAQDRVMPAERPSEGWQDAAVGYIVVHGEIVKPTEAAARRDVVMSDDRGRRWRAANGPDGPLWEAVPA